MKTTLITIIMILFAFSSVQSQLIEPAPDSTPQEFYDYYMIKNQRNKTTAWVCLGGGVGLFIAGTAVGTAGLLDWDSSEMGTGTGMMLAGVVGAAASIPFFIMAGSNKRKARLHFSSTQNTVANIKFDNSRNLGISLIIQLN